MSLKKILTLLITTSILISCTNIPDYQSDPKNTNPELQTGATEEGKECHQHQDCLSGVCDFIKMDIGECAPTICKQGNQTTDIDGYIAFFCNDQNMWEKTKSKGEPCDFDFECGKQTCKDNPSCELSDTSRTKVSCENNICTHELIPDECEEQGLKRILTKDSYTYNEDGTCFESMAQMVLPTICTPCGDGVCDEDLESKCNCPQDCQ